MIQVTETLVHPSSYMHHPKGKRVPIFMLPFSGSQASAGHLDRRDPESMNALPREGLQDDQARKSQLRLGGPARARDCCQN